VKETQLIGNTGDANASIKKKGNAGIVARTKPFNGKRGMPARIAVIFKPCIESNEISKDISDSPAFHRKVMTWLA